MDIHFILEEQQKSDEHWEVITETDDAEVHANAVACSSIMENKKYMLKLHDLFMRLNMSMTKLKRDIKNGNAELEALT